MLGVVGGSLYAVMMVSALAVSWRRYARVRSNGNLLNAALLTWLVLLSTTESTPLEPNQPTILVYAAVIRMCLTEDSVNGADTSEDDDILQGIPKPAVLAAFTGGRPHVPLPGHPALQRAAQISAPSATVLAAYTARSFPSSRRG